MASIPAPDNGASASPPSPLVKLLAVLNLGVAALAGIALAFFASRIFAPAFANPMSDLVAENATVRGWTLGILGVLALGVVVLLVSGFGLFRLRRAAFKCSFYYPVVALAALVLGAIVFLTNFGKVIKGPSPIRDGTFAVALSAPSDASVTVDYSAVGGSATEGRDFQSTASNLVIRAGATTATITVPILGDSDRESATESFTLMLSNITHAILVTPETVGTIWDNDSLPTLTVSDARVRERRHGAVDAVFDVDLSHAVRSNVTVVVRTEDITATAGMDYEAVTYTLQIPAWRTNATIRVPVLGDTVEEGESETFAVTLSDARHAIIGTPRARGMIVEDDGPPTIEAAHATVRERNRREATAKFEIFLSHRSESPVTLDYATVDDTAIASVDYVATAGTLTIPRWRTNAFIRVPIPGDRVADLPQAHFTLALTNAQGAFMAPTNVVGTIVDDDQVPALLVSDAVVHERDWRHANARFTFELAHRAQGPVAITYETVDGTAIAGTDYQPRQGTFTIPKRRTNAVFRVKIPGDRLPERGESTFALRVLDVQGAVLAPTERVGTVVDDDGLPVMSIADIKAPLWGGSLVETHVPVTLSRAAGGPVTVAFHTADGTGQANVHYVPTNGVIEIPERETAASIPVLVRNNGQPSADETFHLILSDPNGAQLATATGLVTLAAAPLLTVTPMDVLEGKAIDDPETLTIRNMMKTAGAIGGLLFLVYPIVMLVLISRGPVLASFKVSLSDETYTVGTLVYTRIGLTTLFAWLLWGDFVFTIMEAVVPSVLPLKLKSLGASNTLMLIILSTLPSILNLTVCPWVSFKSDRHRGRMGRRVPFIVWTMPFLALTLIMLGWSEDISLWLRQAIPATQVIAPNTMAIAVIATLLVVFQFFNMFVNSVFWYLFNDVVPPQFLGRFMGLFRIAGTAASAIYNWYVFRYAESNMREILTGGALIYFVGFGLMCFFVKEGKYPPITGDEAYKRKGFLTDIRIFAKESFSIRFYWYFFLMGALSRVAYALGIFNIFFNRQMGLTLDQMGKLAAVGSIVGIVATYFTAALVDRWHPLRILTYQKLFTAVMGFSGWIWVMMTLPGDLFFWMSMVGTIVAAFDYVLTDAAGIPMMMRILPKSRYGQFSSANAMIRSLATIVAGLVAGGYMDFLMWMCDGSDYAYRWIWTWVWPFNILGTILVVMGYQEWKRRGGDDHYRPPAPWSPDGREEVIDKVKSSPGRPRAVIKALGLGWICAILNIVLVLVFMVSMHRQDMMRSFWWHAQVFLPLKALLACLIYWQIRSVRRDVIDLENGRTPKYGVPHHGVILVETATALLSFAVYWIQMSGMIRIGMERELIIFGVNTLISTAAHSLVATHILRVIERVRPPATDPGLAAPAAATGIVHVDTAT